MASVTLDVDLDDFDDSELIDELEGRGYEVINKHKHEEDLKADPELEEIFWRYKLGHVEDALILIERKYPELYGLSKLLGGK